MSQVPQLDHLLARTAGLITRRRLLGAGVVLLSAVAAGLIGSLWLDGLVALPEALRRPWLPALGGGLIGLALVLVHGLRRQHPSAERTAALVEVALDDGERRLTAAWQLSSMAGELAQAGAARLVAALPLSELPRRLPSARWARPAALLAGLMAVALAVHVSLPGFYAAVWPRLSDPRGDHPPFSLLQISLVDPPTRIREGADLRIEAELGGRWQGVRDVVLVAQDAAGVQTRLAMMQVGEHRHAADLSRVTSAQTLWVEAGGTRTRRHVVTLDPIPHLERLDLTVTSPVWSRLSVETRRLRAGEVAELEALAGATVAFMPTANRPLAAVWIVTGDGAGQRVPVQAGAAAWSASAAAVSLSLEATDGARSAAVPVLRLKERPDQPPRATIVRPAADAFATPGMTIPLTLRADDDLGLRLVTRLRGHNGLDAPPLTSRPSGRDFSHESVLDLKDLGVRPGDVLMIGLIAVDTHPGDGQAAPVAERHIQIVSEEQYNAYVRQRGGVKMLERKYTPMLAELAELRRLGAELAEARKNMKSEDIDKKLKDFNARIGALQQQARAMKRELPLFAAEPELQEAIAKAAEELELAAKEGRVPEPDKDTAATLAQDLALLTRLGQAKGLMARLRQLIDAEQNTVARLDPLAEHRRPTDSDRVRLRELGDQEAQLAEALDQWHRLAGDLANELRFGLTTDKASPESRTAASKAAEMLDALAVRVRDDGAIPLKQGSAASARSGDGPEAHRQAKEARDLLLALLPPTGACEGGLEGACQGIGWCSGKNLLATLRGLGMGAGSGFGMGGAGMGGMGLFLGYGGDDLGMSLGNSTMDLYGPENLGDLAQGHEGADGDGIAAMAAGGKGPVQQATGYRTEVRRTSTTARPVLPPAQQQVVDQYFRALEGR